jgi:predicted nucleic acid-binding protein
LVSILSRDHRERFSEFFSNVLRAGGLPEAVFSLAINGVIQLCVSEAILAEYEEVLRRERLATPPEKVATALARIRERGSLLTPTAKVDAAPAPMIRTI